MRKNMERIHILFCIMFDTGIGAEMCRHCAFNCFSKPFVKRAALESFTEVR